MNKIRKMLLGLFVGLSTSALAIVNINTANIEELQQLKGIGAKKAADIVSYRETHGEFKNVDELINVKGIGKATLEKLRQDLVVSNEAVDSDNKSSGSEQEQSGSVEEKEIPKDAGDNKKVKENGTLEHKEQK